MTDAALRTEDRAVEAKTRISRYWSNIENQSHFQLFGQNGEFDGEKLKASYKLLAKQWHADAYAGVDLGDARETLDAIFQRIQEAYETLADATKRTEYKVLLERRSKGMATDVNEVLRAEQLFDEGLAHSRKHAWEKAKTSFEGALKLNPDDPLLPVHLAWARFNCSRQDKKTVEGAVEMLRKAAQRDDHNPLAWQFLGQITFAVGRTAEAKQAWKRCVDIEPKNVEANRGLRLISSRGQQEEGGLGSLLKNIFKKR